MSMSAAGLSATVGTTLPALLRERAAEIPDRTYVEDVDDRRLTYGEAFEMMRRFAGAYGRAGVGAGDHVVTMQFNTIESMAGWLGLACLGAVETPINTDYKGELLAHALNTARCRTMALRRDYLERVVAISADLPHLKTVILVDGDGARAAAPFEIIGAEEFLWPAQLAGEARDPAPWEIAAVMFTSGTTGPSKGVRMPWGQLFATASTTMPIRDLGPSDVFFNAGPTYHLGAKVFPMLAAMLGARHVMRPYVSLTRQPAEYRKHGVTTAFFPPMAWLDEPPRAADAEVAFRNLLLPLSIPRIDEFKRRFGVRTFSVYSMTELSCPIGDLDWDIGKVSKEGLFSCGVVRAGYPGYEARLVDEWDQPVPTGAVGELIVRTSAPWTTNAGYLNNPEATAQAWRNGWFHTGDAFSQDAEGHFYFRDRIKDCIRRRAENISSFEVESYVRKHPGVADCAAVAEKLSPEPGADEEIRLFVVRKAPGDRTADALAAWLVPRMPRFMVPRFIELIDALPQTATMKVQKALLRGRPRTEAVWDRERAGLVAPR